MAYRGDTKPILVRYRIDGVVNTSEINIIMKLPVGVNYKSVSRKIGEVECMMLQMSYFGCDLFCTVRYPIYGHWESVVNGINDVIFDIEFDVSRFHGDNMELSAEAECHSSYRTSNRTYSISLPPIKIINRADMIIYG